MKWSVALVLTALLLMVAGARAEGPDDQYVLIYNLIQEGDALVEKNQSRDALTKYEEARTALQRFQKGFPDWNPDVVKFRLSYLASKLAAAPKPSPAPEATSTNVNRAPATPAPVQVEKPVAPELQRQFSELKDQVQKLQNEKGQLQNEKTQLQTEKSQLEANKALLEAKLKEALSAMPAITDPRELEKAQEKVRVLQKENELLNATVLVERAKNSAVDPKQATPTKQLVTELNRQLAEQKALVMKLTQEKEALQAPGKSKESETVATLRARITVLEAQPVPYTTEEIALLKQTPALAASSASKKAPRPLSSGAAALAAEAKRYFAAKEFDKAEQKYLEVLKKEDKNPAVLADLAVIQIQMSHYDDADKNINQAVSLAPDDAYCYSTLGHLKFRQGKYDEALNALSRAAELDPESAEIQNRLGIAFSQKGLRKPAEAALRKALQLQPGYADAHHNLAVVYLSQNPPALELARWHYQKAIAAGFPKSPELEKMLEGKKSLH